MRSLFALWFLALLAPAQQWRQTCGRTSSGLIATHQAALDATQDSLVFEVQCTGGNALVVTSTAAADEHEPASATRRVGVGVG